MAKHARSWSDYEREKRRAERKALAARGREGRSTSSAGNRTADDASGCEGRIAETGGLKQQCGRPAKNVSSGPAPAKVAASPHVAAKARQSRIIVTPPPSGRMQSDPFPTGKIDISAAPSGMEAAAARWVGKGPAPIAARPAALLCEGKVFCRCGAQRPGQERGLVPAWFGEKCIEANCELRERA